MALYIPASRRRRQTLSLAAAALVVGCVVGLLVGRGSAPSIDDRVRSVRSDARATAASLRVVALHDQSGAASNQTAAGGADAILRRVRSELRDEFARAIWIPHRDRDTLIAQLDALSSAPDKTTATFGHRAEELAVAIENVFGGG